MTGTSTPGSPAREKTRPIPELLAPAGSPKAFLAAVAAGADAVYLGGKRFGARKYASNFSDDEIRESVRHAHAQGIRVYVTVNTLIHDRELADAMDYLLWLYSIGTDAVLVQDAGLAALAREVVPGLPLHASTQMTIHNAGGVRRAAAMGFSRVVLARELSLAEVSRIADETRESGVGLEVFAHGALCYSYSGQCLLSSLIGGRSGNRGMCAQPCRKPYTLVTGGIDPYGRPLGLAEVPSRGPYLLSPKDLCTFRHLPGLVRSPVVSLKIEGRMKSPEYVATVVMAYRRALDAIAAGNYHESPEAYRDLLLAFNRGFTRGYLFGDRYDTLMGREAPGNRGLRIGTVTRYDRKTSCATVRCDSPVLPAPGDGLLISGPEMSGNGTGFSLNTEPVRNGAEICLPVPRPVSPGSAVSITFSRELDGRIRRAVAHPPAGTLRAVPIDLAVSVTDDGTLLFDGKIQRPDGNVIGVSFRPDLRMEPARSQPVTRDLLETRLKKSGGTPFLIRDLNLTYSGSLFAPLAELNRMRRDFLVTAGDALIAASLPGEEELARARERWAGLAPHYRSPTLRGDTRRPSRLRLAAYTDSIDGVRELAAAGCEKIYFEPDFTLPEHRCIGNGTRDSWANRILEAMTICRASGAGFVWKFPRITRDTYLEKVLPSVPGLFRQGACECMVGNAGTGDALLREEPSLELSGSTGLNIFNHAAALHALPGSRLLTLSPELSGKEIISLVRLARAGADSPDFAVIAEGTGEAMITDDCLVRNHPDCAGKNPDTGKSAGRFLGIRDTTGHVFPVRMDGECRTRIGNAVETCLIDHLPSLLAAGVSEAVIDTQGRTPAYTREICRIYREAVDTVNTGPAEGNSAVLKSLRERVRQIALGGITAGHFIRGLGT